MRAAEVNGKKVTDYELAKRSAGGDVDAFEELYRRHYRRVYAVTFRMLGDPTDAEDLTQETFTHLFKTIGSFRGDSAFTTWLHRMAVNQVLMYFRRRSSRPEYLVDEAETPTQIVQGTANHNKMPVVDHIILENAIKKLAPGYRSVFVLHDVEGHEHSEIAEMLGISEGTSKSQLHKARLKLREIIKGEAKPR